MSAFFRVPLGGEPRDVEITRAGELVILGYDWEQDDMMRFMTGQESEATMLLEQWRASSADVIFGRLGIDRYDLIKLSADWAEHVLPVFENIIDSNMRPRNVIVRVREYVDEPMTQYSMKHAADELRREATTARGEADKIKYSLYAASNAANAASLVAELVLAFDFPGIAIMSRGWVINALVRATLIAAQDGAEERSWQIRHFVHTMECLQTNKKWPDIKETP